MNPYFYITTSSQEEEQFVAKFLKILKSLGEHASSYLFQKGVVLGDENFDQYEEKLNDEKYRKSVVNTIMRPGDKDSLAQDLYPTLAVLLLKLSNEATQMFLDIKTRSHQQTGTSTGIIALGYHLALIDRITVFLNLPSINDKAFWNLMTGSPQSAPPPAPPVHQSPPTTQPSTVAAEKPAVVQPKLPPKPEQQSPVAPPTPPPSAIPTQTKTPAPSEKLAPSQTPSVKKAVKPREKPKQALSSKTPPAPVVEHPRKNPPAKNAAIENTQAKANETTVETIPETTKTEGPLKAMVRRIVEEIHDDSYEAVISAIKDSTLMKDLYNSPNNPITVKILEVDTKDRKIHLTKQKLGAKEVVTFRLIRKLLSEL